VPDPNDPARTAGGGNAVAQDGDVEDALEKITEQIQDRDDAAEIALAAVDELADRASEVEALKAERDAAREQLLRKAAEFQNYRRRTEQEKAGLVDLGKSLVVQQLLGVLDDLERSLGAAQRLAQQEGSPGPAYDTLYQGVDLIYRKFVDELKRLGVSPIEAVGRPFDEHEHEALMQRAAPEGTPRGVVLEELQRGYRLDDRILRHTKVVVSS
jgi:molecular chaperone GrpE